MDLLMAHQKLSDAKDFGVTEAGENLNHSQIENLMEEVTVCSREAMGVITVGKEHLKIRASSSAAMVPYCKGKY